MLKFEKCYINKFISIVTSIIMSFRGGQDEVGGRISVENWKTVKISS